MLVSYLVVATYATRHGYRPEATHSMNEGRNQHLTFLAFFPPVLAIVRTELEELGRAVV
jgi:hypothetical protein